MTKRGARGAAACLGEFIAEYAGAHGKSVEVYSNRTKVLVCLDQGEEARMDPDYVGTYTKDGAQDATEDLIDHWGRR